MGRSGGGRGGSMRSRRLASGVTNGRRDPEALCPAAGCKSSPGAFSLNVRVSRRLKRLLGGRVCRREGRCGRVGVAGSSSILRRELLKKSEAENVQSLLTVEESMDISLGRRISF
jgi:hypothetical protein